MTQSVRKKLKKLHPDKLAQMKRELEKVEKAEKIARLLKNMLSSAGLDYDDIGLYRRKPRSAHQYVAFNAMDKKGIDTKTFATLQEARKYALSINGSFKRRYKRNATIMTPTRPRPSDVRHGI